MAAITIFLGYLTVYRLVGMGDPQRTCIFWIGFMFGYWIYDLTHYSLHHISTKNSKGSWFHRLQMYHNQHHFGGEEAGFGVSSPLWDFVFGTRMSHKNVH